jgi:hypothetical protein
MYRAHAQYAQRRIPASLWLQHASDGAAIAKPDLVAVERLARRQNVKVRVALASPFRHAGIC